MAFSQTSIYCTQSWDGAALAPGYGVEWSSSNPYVRSSIPTNSYCSHDTADTIPVPGPQLPDPQSLIRESMRIGLFGGSFDPIHLGHVQLARSCQHQARLDEVWFLPTAKQPFKHQGPIASDEQRLAMLSLATASEPTWHIDTREINRGGVSYTYQTLRELRAEMPAAELFFMMGADSLHDLPSWREPEEICLLATPLVVARAGEPKPDFNVLQTVCDADRITAIRNAAVAMPPTPIASSLIRTQIARGRDASEQLPQGVYQYIMQHSLYSVDH